jgi:thiamine pyrophosphate-dependent acetolactate synthase large subunit-like protein
VGLGVVEDPQFECSDYDSPEVEERRYKGRHIAVRVTAGTGLETLLYRFEGEPDLSVMHQLHKEYVAKKQEEEERRKRIEEEMRRRMEEEEKKRNDPSKIIEAVKAALPEWADGAVIVAKRVCSEDCDVYYLAYPVKRSSRNARYYYSPEWRTLRLAVPDRFLEKFADCIVTRDGSVIKVQRTEGSGKYVTLKPA